MVTIKKKTVLWSVAVVILSTLLTFTQRKFFPDTEPVYLLDSTAVAQYEEKIATEKAYNMQKDLTIKSKDKTIDSLRAAKNKIIIKKVPTYIIVKRDSLIYKDSVVHETTVVIDTLLKPIEVNEINEVLPDIKKEQYGTECYVLGTDKKGTTIRVNRKNIKDNEVLYFVDGNTLEQSLVTFYNGTNIKRKLKFKQSSVYVLITSYDENIDKRLDSIIKNKNKF